MMYKLTHNQATYKINESKDWSIDNVKAIDIAILIFVSGLLLGIWIGH